MKIIQKEAQASEVLHLASLVSTPEQGIQIENIRQNAACSMRLFAFAEGASLATHTATGDAVVMVLEGEAEINLHDKPHRLVQGEMLIMPAHAPHAVKAISPFKMLLSIFKV